MAKRTFIVNVQHTLVKNFELEVEAEDEEEARDIVDEKYLLLSTLQGAGPWHLQRDNYDVSDVWEKTSTNETVMAPGDTRLD